MRKKTVSIVFFVFITILSFSQKKKKDVLLTIDGKPVYASEFARVFKKNLDLVQDDSQKNVAGYLDLFIDYKLKIAEAYNQGLDTTVSYVKEFNKYRDQLSRNYIYEDAVTEEVAREAYERSLEQINADHILVKVGYNATPKDTLEAYNKIVEIRKKALAGEDFNALAKKYSEEPAAKERGGKLGWFSALQMVYPFETAAYNTEVGTISDIVRTSYGYHIIKVNDRRKTGNEISVSHIMVTPKKNDSTFNPKERIYEIYAMLMQGESFESLAKQFSDDKGSGQEGGKLKPFGRGRIRAPKFEDVAFSLKKEGEISEPFQSKFGWHIIRLDKILPIKTFEERKADLEQKVSKGDRSKKINQTVAQRIKEKFGFKKGESYLPFFTSYVSDSILENKWKYTPIAKEDDRVIFTIGNKKITFNDFAKFIEANQGHIARLKIKEKKLKNLYSDFEAHTVKEYFKEQLEKENPEYAAILDEYRNGLLIFDVMEKNVWNKAKTDSLGAKAFYEKNKENYLWQTRIEGAIFSTSQPEVAKQVRQLLSQGKSVDEIKNQINKDGKIQVIVTTGIFEITQKELPKDFKPSLGVSEIYNKENTYVIVQTNKIIPPEPKPFKEVKGKVISDYQNYLEKEWMQSLRAKHQISINKKTLKKLKKQFKS